MKKLFFTYTTQGIFPYSKATRFLEVFLADGARIAIYPDAILLFPPGEKEGTYLYKVRKGGENPTFVAVLSTTVLPLDGTYRVETLPPGDIPSLVGVPHYIGHPDTKAIVEELGAVPAQTKLFPGLAVGEQAICFPIAQGKSTRAENGFTSPHQNVSLQDLQVRVITRLE